MIKILIIAIVLFSAAYVLIKGIYKRNEKSKNQSQIGRDETGESGSEDSSEE